MVELKIEFSGVDDATTPCELSTLTSRIADLNSRLARARSDAASLRAKTVTVSVSLNAAKDELQSLVQSESGMHTSASGSDQRAMVRALSAQLDETRRSVAHAVASRDTLRSAVKLLEFQMDVRDDNTTPTTTDPHEVGTINRVLIRKLQAEDEMNSAYREDHTRIWKDAALPNVGLIQENGTASMGVVAERLFAQVTSFVPSATEASECIISQPETVRSSTEDEVDAILPHYSAMVLRDASGANAAIRVIATEIALARVLQLANRSSLDYSPTSLSLSSAAVRRIRSGLTPDSSKQSSPNRILPTEGKQRPPPRLSDPSHVLNAEHFAFLMNDCVPPRFHDCDLQLLYSTNRDGMSVNTLYHKVKASSPTVIAVRDTNDRSYGCYAAAPWKSSALRYYGTGECFVFSAKPKLAAYKWSRKNHFFQFSLGGILAIGGGPGSHFALWVDEDLLMGTTSACSTFDSPPLTNEEGNKTDRIDFRVVSLEVWTIVPRSSSFLAADGQ